MATPSWNISGHYFETCSCDFSCPCTIGQVALCPGKGACIFAMTMHIERGSFGAVALNGLSFIVLGYTPEEMGKGNWSVGLVIDECATAEQRDAITAIASGTAGGPMSPLSGLIGKFLGVASATIQFDRSGRTFTVKAGKLVEMGAEDPMGLDPKSSEPVYLGNTGHSASAGVAVAHATKSHVHAFGVNWDDESGRNNGHFAPFNWRSA